jgi:predicted metal-dependent hydrolase
MSIAHGQEHRRVVRFGSAEIEYGLTERVRRDLAITVHPDLSVTVVDPPGRRPEHVDAHVQARAPWIIRQQLRFKDLHPLPSPTRYVIGESHGWCTVFASATWSGGGVAARPPAPSH